MHINIEIHTVCAAQSDFVVTYIICKYMNTEIHTLRVAQSNLFLYTIQKDVFFVVYIFFIHYIFYMLVFVYTFSIHYTNTLTDTNTRTDAPYLRSSARPDESYSHVRVA